MPSFSGLPYTTVDVFTNTTFAGNPLAIIQLPTSHQLNQTTKQQIAREFNFSETVFLHVSDTAASSRKWHINIFTTTDELPFAGHPTIGTAWSLTQMFPDLNEGTLITKAGPIYFTVDRSQAEKVQVSTSIPHNVHIHSKKLSREHLVKIQPALKGILPELSAEGSEFVSIVKGMTFAMIKLDSIETLDKVELSEMSIKPYFELDEGWTPSFGAPYFYYVDEAKSTDTKFRVHTRMIEAGFGEDPATGSAASGLGSFLALQQSQGKEDADGKVFEFDIEQGRKMGRASAISVKVVMKGAGEIDKVYLGGSAVEVTTGSFA